MRYQGSHVPSLAPATPSGLFPSVIMNGVSGHHHTPLSWNGLRCLDATTSKSQDADLHPLSRDRPERTSAVSYSGGSETIQAMVQAPVLQKESIIFYSNQHWKMVDA